MPLLGSEEAGQGSIPLAAGVDSPGSGGAGNTGSIIAVANLTALAALPSAKLSPGEALAFVISRSAFFALQTSTLPTNLIDTVAASGLAGAQWLRLRIPDKGNTSQLTYSVDELNITGTASDDNTGLDDAHALLTAAELSYRVEGAVYGAGVCCVVRNLSQMSNAYFNVRGVRAGAVPAGSPNTLFPSSFAVVGVPTVVYTGTIGTPTQVSAGGNGTNTFNDATGPAFTTVNRIWQRTNGTKAQFWPQSGGDGTFRISQPSTNFTQATLVDGDTYTISSMPTIAGLKFPTGNTQKQIQIALCYDTTTPSSGDCNANVLWICCQFSQSNNYAGSFYNCAEFERNFANTAMAPQVLVAGGLIRNACNIPAGSIVHMSATSQYVSVQGVALTIDFGARLAESNLMFFDLATPCVVLGTANATAYFNSFGGFGCSSKIVNVSGRNCSAIFKASALPPAGMTTDASPYEINGASIATPTSAGNVDTTILSQVNSQ